ncbi:MAG: hypothetical protein M3O15_05050, partial [Acidobacteriota bacterium]|nr:hypothetical protein [Acidobacteriota bacterium]
ATRADPRYSMAWVSLGAADMLLGQSGSALDSYDRALALDPHNWLAHYNLALYSTRRGDREAAFSHLRQALTTAPNAGRERREMIRELLADPQLETIRHDPRFAGILGDELAGAAGSAR